MMNRIDDLKSFAAKACLDIYHDYTYLEVAKLPPSVQNAWRAGGDIDHKKPLNHETEGEK